MNLQLKNPIAFIDLETTGINVAADRIVEICILKVMPNGHEEIKTFRINPTIPIPPKSTEIHGITDEDVKNEPTFKEVGKVIARMLEGCDLAGYNSNKFDFPLLAEEFIRAEIDFDMKKRKFIDVQVIFHKMEQRTLSAAYKFYCNKDHNDAHSAEADVKATWEILNAQLDKYKELEKDVVFLNEFSSQNKNVDFAGRIIYDENGVEVFNFGKYKGMSVTSIFDKDPGYYGWILNGDFPLYTKKIMTSIKLRGMNK
ncbi:MAG: DNA polymerase III subunit epsilon [Bacteroidetes bacterium GWF2_38_335]|nr:MAG: DNA polymerase III subunit epsilon [Bacteroidetes bacterium GWF2_38_335]OFY80966.1 MAG: DNA polymerase III subunit epsilon [Bacteroidetes bacterium RIFOXYA12_FULL_38_20]HBS85097.1 DNA polymerase III subunit epsilon [Bacteroidales bacterium]